MITITKEVDVDVELDDVIDYIIDVNESCRPGSYVERQLKEFKNALLDNEILEEKIYSMDREQFERIYDIMSNSWQNLTR